MSHTTGFRAEFLAELDIATRQILELANAFPADAYDWYPASRARSVSEVFVHIASGNYLLLDAVGAPVAVDLYHHLPTAGPSRERFLAFLRTNDDLVANIREKSDVIALLQRSFEAVDAAFRQSDDLELDRELDFAGQPRTVRGIYLRLLVHNHQHMGQMVAYLRCNDIAAPWPDWKRARDTDHRGEH